MKKIIKAPAKINLYLRINDKRDDGYHDLTMVLQEISLYDTIEIEIFKNDDILSKFPFIRKNIEKENQIVLKSNFNYIPTDDRNLVIKVVKYIFEKYSIKDKVFIYLKKMIPTNAGLGGGSSDAASMLMFLNKYYKLNLTYNELSNIAIMFGSDIPFFLNKQECICCGRGELITKIDDFKKYFILIATPDIHISTKETYEEFDINSYKSVDRDGVLFDKLVEAILNKDLNGLVKNISNDLEQVVCNKYDTINIFKTVMMDKGALNAMMSGSGSTVYGIFNNKFKAEACKNYLKEKYNNAFVFVACPIK